MPLNCPHAWEEYKKLETARHVLREEFLALSRETGDFKNVSREKVEQWRELYKKSKAFEVEWNSFLDEFFYVRRAKEIMGDQFYGPEEIENAFGFKVPINNIPKMPYSREELKQAKELGERLVLRISEDEKGNSMTMEHINELAQSRMAKGEDKGKLLDNREWYNNEDFFKKQSLKMEWELVGGNFVKNSKYKNYLEQTKVLRDYLESLGSLTEEELEECSDENLSKIADDAEKLADLKINQNHRRTPGEVLYDWFLHFKKFKARDYLEQNYDWTNIVSSGGNLVSIGLDSDRAYVNGLFPVLNGRDLGVVSVR